MKKLFYAFAVSAILFGCSGQDGKDGDPGPKGDKGETGTTGATGPAGPKGEPAANTSQAYTYDFNLDVTKTLGGYAFKIPVDPQEFVLVFLRKNDNFYTAVPYAGYAFDVNKNFLKVDMTYEYSSFTLYVDSKTVLPAGATFVFRAVVIKGTPGKRLNMERYKDYENVKSDFGLKD
jgi:hypothetical protein